jgi:hypothetical protein
MQGVNHGFPRDMLAHRFPVKGFAGEFGQEACQASMAAIGRLQVEKCDGKC